jgi:hypothetical protein
MAIEYFVYSDLDKADMELRLLAAGKSANDFWVAHSVSDDLGPFHKEIMEGYGVDKGFKTSVYCRHSKDHTVEARREMLALFESLPGRKLLLNGDVLVEYRRE